VWWPWSIVAAAVGWNLASLRALTLNVAYFNDSTLHEQMVRFATARLRAGHLPLTSWFPFLGEGSPQFLHYQSLPAILTDGRSLSFPARCGCSRAKDQVGDHDRVVGRATGSRRCRRVDAVGCR
jgi:hypothetical protein